MAENEAEKVEESVSEQEIEEVTSRPVKTQAQARDKVTDLEDLIADVRRDQARDRKDRDNIIGELKAQIEEQETYLSEIKRQFEKARKRPQQTMVPPPPPPEQAEEVDRPLTEGTKPEAKQRGFLRNVW